MQLQEKSQQQQFKIPQTIQQHKRGVLKYKMLSTITGLEVSQIIVRPLIIAIWLAVVTSFVVLKFVPGVTYGVCIGVNMGVCVLFSIIYNFIASQPCGTSTIHKSFFSCLFGFLWSHHLHYSQQSQLITLTLISIVFSLGTVLFTPVQQFTSPTLYLKQLSIHSVRYIRIMFPLVIFIIELILDYGQFLSQSTRHLYYIRLSISLVFLTWTFGCISTIYNTYFFIVNNVNRFLFGDQAKANFTAAFIKLVLNCIPIAVYLGWAESDSKPYWILWIGSSITSIVGFAAEYVLNDKFDKRVLGFRSILMIVIETAVCGGLLALMLLVDFKQLASSIQIITVVDVVIYVFFGVVRFCCLPRNWLGMAINISSVNNQYCRALQRIILRISAGFTVFILIQNLQEMQLWMKLHQTLVFHVDVKFVQYFFIPFMVYRSYKRSLSQSVSFSFHLSVLISLGFAFTGRELQSILVVLFFPPFTNNFSLAFIAPFLTPKKLTHKNQLLYQIAYLFMTAASTTILVLSIGMLQFTMFFGLPVFLCILPTINEGNKIKSKQHSLYEKIIQHIPQQLFRFQRQGFYLLRISKYIILIQIKQQCYGFAQLIDIKGLQVQQVTSCHSKQGQTIDKLVQQTFGDNASFINVSHLWTVLSPLGKSVVHVPTQNQIQLTGVIESQEFISLFKLVTLKALVYQVAKITYTQRQITEAEDVISDFNPICKKEKFDNLFPFEFSKQLNLEVQYPDTARGKNSHAKKKLPPIKNKKQIQNDFMDLLDSSPRFNPGTKIQTSTHELMKNDQNNNKQQQVFTREMQTSSKIQQTSKKIDTKQLNACLIMTLYHYSVGKFDYFNIKRMHDLIKMQKGELNQITFDQSERILSRALSKAFKISVDKNIMGEDQIQLADFEDYQKAAFLGVAGSESFNQAVANNIQDIWTLNYAKGKLSIKRLASSQNQLYMFKADSFIVKATWNNLRFELIYATNDNDERYSIQTHPYLMRNLWTQACEEPFGYPSYHSGNLLNT